MIFAYLCFAVFAVWAGEGGDSHFAKMSFLRDTKHVLSIWLRQWHVFLIVLEVVVGHCLELGVVVTGSAVSVEQILRIRTLPTPVRWNSTLILNWCRHDLILGLELSWLSALPPPHFPTH